MTNQTSREYRYLCVLSGIGELTPELSEAIFQAVDAEIELNLRDGMCSLECIRSATSLEDAATATIDELQRAVSGVRVVRVETDDSKAVARINSQLLSTVQSP